MLNSNKTWQERLWDRFKSPLGYSSIDNKNNSMYDLEKFISDLRKRDMEAMLKITDDYYDGEGIEDWNKRLQLIKDYYEK